MSKKNRLNRPLGSKDEIPEEFTGVPIVGEFPEWEPGTIQEKRDGEDTDDLIDDAA